MLKNFLLGLIVLLSIKINAQNFDSLRIYINPGHGGHNPSNDRYIPETGFWESEGNLSKGLYLRDILLDMNADIRMSRTQNRDQDDLPLSQIVADANNFDADYFHSIHSNAWNGERNYTLLLFQGFDNAPTYPEAKQMGEIISTQIYTAHRTSTHYNRGDFDFYGTGKPYLGVFKGLLMPGTLSEGSFHDYIPESWRLKDEAYLKHEAWAIARSFVHFYGLTPMPFGEIAGIVRIPDQSVSYFFLSSTNDRKKPINNIRVTLQPGNIVYSGDSLNNGFFLFDKLAPGNYKVIYEAEDYAKDSTEVMVTANKTVFADKFLTLAPNYNVPKIVFTSPDTNSTQVRLNTSITLDFDIPMNKTSVQNAFAISPSISGSFSWEDNDKHLTFKPDSKLIPNTNYTVSIDTTAKTLFDVNLNNKYNLLFKTREKLNLVLAYPWNNSVEISTTVKIILNFDAPLNVNTLANNIFFQDENGESISLVADQSAFAKGSIIFRPVQPLQNSSHYKVILKDGLGDVDGLFLGQNYEFNFTTEKEQYVGGNIIDNFDNIGQWWQPEQSGSTTGIDPEGTSFTISNESQINGSPVGKLEYKFFSDSGVCRIYDQAEQDLGSSDQSNFGIWINGDLSYNLLEFWFRDANGSNVSYFVDTLNWTGWKVKSVNLGNLNIQGDKKFHSVVVRKSSNGKSSGVVFLDDAQTDILVPVNEETNKLPVKFKLSQNYPNPFNPTTTIKYTIPTPLNPPFAKGGNTRGVLITLKVYDVLGREVGTLVDKKQKPGAYKVEFNASDLPSGVYLYKLKAGSYVQVRKMILLK